MDRRNFLKKSTLAIGLSGLPFSTIAAIQEKNPYTHKTILSLIETLIPSAKFDPSGAPGANEVLTIEYLQNLEKLNLFDIPFIAFRAYLCGALNSLSFFKYGHRFHKLSLKKREVVAHRAEMLPGVAFAYRIIRAPFYTASMNRLGYDYLGYPGTNSGYIDHSFEKEMSMPHPRSINGNLP